MSIPNSCSVDQVTNWISAVGAGLRIDHNPGAAMNQAIVFASADVAYYLSMRFPNLETLAENTWVQAVTTLRAVWYLCTWRLNAVPAWLQSQWDQYKLILVDIQMGKGNVPGLPIGTAKDRTPILVHTTNTLLGPSSLSVTYNGVPVRQNYGPGYWG